MLQGVCTEAGMYALRERRVHVTQEDFEMAVAKVLVGVTRGLISGTGENILEVFSLDGKNLACFSTIAKGYREALKKLGSYCSVVVCPTVSVEKSRFGPSMASLHPKTTLAFCGWEWEWIFSRGMHLPIDLDS